MVNPNYAKGVNAATFDPNVNAAYSMIEKVARQVMRGVVSSDRLSVFEKTPIDNGTTIEEVVIKLAESTAFNSSATDVFAATNPSLVVQYYKNWTPKQFATTVKDNDVRKVLLSNGNVNDLAEPVVASLTNGDIYEKYLATRGLFDWAATNGVFTNSGDVVETNYKGILGKLKDIVSGMQFTNTTFNSAGIARQTFADNIRIVMPYTIKNSIDVNELAGVFNLSKDELGARIIEIDTGNRIYVVDEQAILVYTRLYQMTTEYNPKALHMNYWLTTDRLYAVSPLFDGTYITVTAPTGD